MEKKNIPKKKIRAKKSELFKKLKNNRGSKEWDFHFLKYAPAEEKTTKKKRKKTKKTKKKTKKKTRKKKKKFFF